MSPERRKHKRIRMTGKLKPIPATFKAENVSGEGHIGSMSCEGLFFATETVPRVGEFVTVIFSDHSGNKIEVWGAVSSTTTQLGVGNSGFGMQLESLTDEYQELYEELLTS